MILVSMAIPYLLLRKGVNEVDLSPVGNSHVVDFNELDEVSDYDNNYKKYGLSRSPYTTTKNKLL